MENRKIAIIAMIIIAGVVAYFGVQRYQSHHALTVKIQGTGVLDPRTGEITFLPSGPGGITPEAVAVVRQA